MTKDKQNRNDDALSDGILDADDTGLVRNEAEIVQEEIDEGLSPEELPVDGRGVEGRSAK